MHADDTFDLPWLLYLAVGSGRDVAIIFSSVPLVLTDGVLDLWLRAIPFSISVGVGFIALSGIHRHEAVTPSLRSDSKA